MGFTQEQIANTQAVLAAVPNATSIEQVALVEAGLVESGMRNLPSGDQDSAGIFQERPSQGWTNVTNIQDATRQMLAHFNTSLTDAGAMAQSGERSAFPARYDQMQSQALQLMAAAQIAPSDASAAASAVGSALASPVQQFATTWGLRAGLVVFGAVMMLVGVWTAVGHKPSEMIPAITGKGDVHGA